MISIQNVSKSFGMQHVLRNVSLEINDNETVAVVGPSGVGKSVLLKLIMGIFAVDHGQILIAGDNITTARSEAEKNVIRSKMGILFQSAALFDSLNVYQNITFPLVERTGYAMAEIQERAQEVIKSLSLQRYLKSLPQELSIGIRKRVGIARALICEPKIFLFDEPNTGLDPIDGREVYDLITECQKSWKFAGMVISHEIPEVFQVSDRVAMLLNGQIEQVGTPEELISSTNPAVQQFIQGKIDGPIKIQ